MFAACNGRETALRDNQRACGKLYREGGVGISGRQVLNDTRIKGESVHGLLQNGHKHTRQASLLFAWISEEHRLLVGTVKSLLFNMKDFLSAPNRC